MLTPVGRCDNRSDETRFLPKSECQKLAVSGCDKLLGVQIWPNKGLHFAMLAKLAAHLEHDREAREFASKALQQLQYTHANSPVFEEVRQIAFEASRSQQTSV